MLIESVWAILLSMIITAVLTYTARDFLKISYFQQEDIALASNLKRMRVCYAFILVSSTSLAFFHGGFVPALNVFLYNLAQFFTFFSIIERRVINPKDFFTRDFWGF